MATGTNAIATELLIYKKLENAQEEVNENITVSNWLCCTKKKAINISNASKRYLNGYLNHLLVKYESIPSKYFYTVKAVYVGGYVDNLDQYKYDANAASEYGNKNTRRFVTGYFNNVFFDSSGFITGLSSAYNRSCIYTDGNSIFVSAIGTNRPSNSKYYKIANTSNDGLTAVNEINNNNDDGVTCESKTYQSIIPFGTVEMSILKYVNNNILNAYTPDLDTFTYFVEKITAGSGSTNNTLTFVGQQNNLSISNKYAFEPFNGYYLIWIFEHPRTAALVLGDDFYNTVLYPEQLNGW